MKVRYFVQQQQMMALRRDLTMPWWMKLLGFRDQWKWVGSFGQAGHTYVEDGDPYDYGALGLGYAMQPSPSDCTLLVPGTED